MYNQHRFVHLMVFLALTAVGFLGLFALLPASALQTWTLAIVALDLAFESSVRACIFVATTFFAELCMDKELERIHWKCCVLGEFSLTVLYVALLWVDAFATLELLIFAVIVFTAHNLLLCTRHMCLTRFVSSRRARMSLHQCRESLLSFASRVRVAKFVAFVGLANCVERSLIATVEYRE